MTTPLEKAAQIAAAALAAIGWGKHDTRRPRWRIPPEFAGSYEPDESGQHVRSIERTVIRSNGSPYRVRERLLKPRLHKQSGLWYVRLATGRRRRYYTLYEARR